MALFIDLFDICNTIVDVDVDVDVDDNNLLLLTM